MENKFFFETAIKILGRTKEAIEMMTGSKIFYEKESLVISDIQASEKIKNIHIKLNELDLVDIFYLDKAGNVLTIDNNIYIGQIKEIIEDKTDVLFSF